MNEQVVSISSDFREGMAGSDRLAEEVSDEDDLGGSSLVRQLHRAHGCSTRRRQVDSTVPRAGKSPPAALVGVRAVQVVAAEHDGTGGVDRKAICTVVSGAVRAAWDLFVDLPQAGRVAMSADLLGQSRTLVDGRAVRERNANGGIGKEPGRTKGGQRRIGALVQGRHQRDRPFARETSCPSGQCTQDGNGHGGSDQGLHAGRVAWEGFRGQLVVCTVASPGGRG